MLIDGREISNAVDGRRIVAETNVSNAPAPAPSPGNASSRLVLAGKRTHRRDPSDGFNYYNGGWDFSDSHYVYVSLLSHACLFRYSLFSPFVFLQTSNDFPNSYRMVFGFLRNVCFNLQKIICRSM